ncbi:MAG: hypothetical protein JO353_01550 [Phycisphaerae bacterium]|nr:hypothetical protein [Phycisphaerae bacterium]
MKRPAGWPAKRRVANGKIIIELKTPTAASDDCLPHAAMTLGSNRGVGIRPPKALVNRLVIQEQMGQWCMYRMDDGGGFVGDSWHPSKDDAVQTAIKEFGQQVTGAMAANASTARK